MGFASNVVNGIRRGAWAARAFVKVHSPVILLGAGIGLMVGGAVCLYYKSRHVHRHIAEQREWEFNLFEDDQMPDELAGKDAEVGLYIFQHRLGTAFEVAKDLVWPVVLFGGSVACFVISHNIQASRIAALSAAYNGLMAAFVEYRDKVRAQFGEDVDEGYAHGMVIDHYDEENQRYVMTDADEAFEALGLSPTFMHADEFELEWSNATSNCWSSEKLVAENFLRSAESTINAKLRAERGIWLSDIFDILGMNIDFKASFPEARLIGRLVSDEEVLDWDSDETLHPITLGIYDPWNESMNYNPHLPQQVDEDLRYYLTIKGLDGCILPDVYWHHGPFAQTPELTSRTSTRPSPSTSQA